MTPATVGHDQWVYFGTYTAGKSKGIYAARLDAVGKLTEPQLAAAAINPSFLAVDPTCHFLYAITETTGVGGKKQGAVAAYSINGRTGLLTDLNQQLSGGEGLCHIRMDATGKTVLVASYSGGSLTAFPVEADGRLGKPASFIQHHGASVNPLNQKGPHAHCIVTDPSNRFALACDLGLDQVLIYKFDPRSSTLATNSPASAAVTPGSGPRHLAFHPHENFVYVINEMGASLAGFDYDPQQGTLSEIQTIGTLAAGRKIDPGITGAEVVAHPSGKFLYCSTRGADVISLFSIDEKTGWLTRVDTIPSGGRTPRNFNLDPAGKFLLAANQNSDNVAVFQINPKTGRLTPTSQILEIGNPSCVVFGPKP